MDSVMDGGGQLERGMRTEPLGAFATASIVLHAALFAGLLFYGYFSGFHRQWGNPGAGSAIEVTLNSAAIPLPNDQPKNDNVLPPEKPSPAPEPPAPKAAAKPLDQTAIPIKGPDPKQEKPKPVKAVPKAPPPPPKVDPRVQYGQQAGSKLSRSATAQQAQTDQPVSVSDGDFASRFGWYVDGIKRKVSQNWFSYQVASGTPNGARVEIYFRLNRQGVPSGNRVTVSSGSPTLDRSCLLATQRVDTFGDLPAQSGQSYLDVTYHCTYAH